MHIVYGGSSYLFKHISKTARLLIDIKEFTAVRATSRNTPPLSLLFILQCTTTNRICITRSLADTIIFSLFLCPRCIILIFGSSFLLINSVSFSFVAFCFGSFHFNSHADMLSLVNGERH